MNYKKTQTSQCNQRGKKKKQKQQNEIFIQGTEIIKNQNNSEAEKLND